MDYETMKENLRTCISSIERIAFEIEGKIKEDQNDDSIGGLEEARDACDDAIGTLQDAIQSLPTRD